jgi:lipid II:glycine glycyltransferase (peptidoglycan interpeptide bridge formation enzyme)
MYIIGRSYSNVCLTMYVNMLTMYVNDKDEENLRYSAKLKERKEEKEEGKKLERTSSAIDIGIGDIPDPFPVNDSPTPMNS